MRQVAANAEDWRFGRRASFLTDPVLRVSRTWHHGWGYILYYRLIRAKSELGTVGEKRGRKESKRSTSRCRAHWPTIFEADCTEVRRGFGADFRRVDKWAVYRAGARPVLALRHSFQKWRQVQAATWSVAMATLQRDKQIVHCAVRVVVVMRSQPYINVWRPWRGSSACSARLDLARLGSATLWGWATLPWGQATNTYKSNNLGALAVAAEEIILLNGDIRSDQSH